MSVRLKRELYEIQNPSILSCVGWRNYITFQCSKGIITEISDHCQARFLYYGLVQM